jgi:hypothetical protein
MKLNLKCKIRFDTTTAFAAMVAGTQYSIQLEFKGPTMTSSNVQQGLKLNFPVCFINNAGDPSIGGPDQVLTSDVEFHILRDGTSSTGYAIQAILTNQRSNFA